MRPKSRHSTAEALKWSEPLEEVFEKCNGVQEYFERQADKTPNNIALEYESKTLTYYELDQKSNQLAHYLRKNGVSKEVFVGVFMERSFEMFVAILGVLKAGGAYVPLDPEYPKERLSFLVDDIQTPIVLTQFHLTQKLPEAGRAKYLCVDSEWTEISPLSQKRLTCINEPHDAMFMTYTSGSTGQPKGCINIHRGLANYLQWWKKKYPLNENEKILHKTPFTFVASVPEIFRALLSGASVVIARPGGHKDSGYLVKLIQEKSINDTQFVPSMLQTFLAEEGAENCTSLHRVITSGEALSSNIVRAFYKRLPHAQLINRYGATETSGCVSFWECDPKQDRSIIPVGFPIPNNRVYILDEFLKPVPVGEYGEVYMAGVQVGRGYWKQPELTQKFFTPDPFSKDTKAKMFKAGDRARFLPNGAIEYQGRTDFQVKLRGIRVEPGEIEIVLIEHPQIKQAVVVPKKLNGEVDVSSLMAYLVSKEKNPLPSELRNFLKKKLPEYMIPAGFVFLEALPRLTSGKINRKALTDRHDETNTTAEKYSPPVNEIEKRLVKVWEEVLQVKPIGRDHNYFALGGDSLNLIQTLHLLQKNKFDLNLEDLYDRQTIAEIAEIIHERKRGGISGDDSLPPIEPLAKTSPHKHFPLSLVQEKMWYPIQAGAYTSELALINRLTGPLNVPVLKESLSKIIDRHWVIKSKFGDDGEKPYQVISAPEIEFFFQKDFRELPQDAKEESASKELIQNCLYSFDLRKSPLIRCDLLRLEDEEYYIVINIHHMVSDAISLNILSDELAELYRAKIEGRAPVLPELPLQYADFAFWERKYTSGRAIDRKLSYWKKALRDLPLLEIKTDFPRASAKSSSRRDVGTVRRTIRPALVEKLKTFSKRQNVTLNITFMSAFSTLLQRKSGQRDIVFHIISSQRPVELSNLIGYFVKFLPIRMSHLGQPSHLELLHRTRETVLNCYANSIDDGRIVESLTSEEDVKSYLNRRALFNFIPGGRDPLDLRGVNSEVVTLDTDIAFTDDINIEILVLKNEINITFFYDQKLFREKTVVKTAEQFEALLEEIASS